MTLTGSAVLAAGFAALVLAGCGGPAAVNGVSGNAAPAVPVSAPATVIPANPVTLVKMAGATTEAVNGQVDIYGDRYADGTLPGATIPGCSESYTDVNHTCLEAVQVYTYATVADQARYDQQNATPTDGNVVIHGAKFDMTVAGVSVDGVKWVYPVSPATIAARVHGTLATP